MLWQLNITGKQATTNIVVPNYYRNAGYSDWPAPRLRVKACYSAPNLDHHFPQSAFALIAVCSHANHVVAREGLLHAREGLLANQDTWGIKPSR